MWDIATKWNVYQKHFTECSNLRRIEIGISENMNELHVLHFWWTVETGIQYVAHRGKIHTFLSETIWEVREDKAGWKPGRKCEKEK